MAINSNHTHPLFDNVLGRQFDGPPPYQVCASDVTYICPPRLTVLFDLYLRKVVGRSMNFLMKAQLLCDALIMAIWQCRPKASLIHHLEWGYQYASKAFRQWLLVHGLKGSMSCKSDCWGSAVVEYFFGSLKQEWV